MERAGDRAAAHAARDFLHVVSLLANEAASIAHLVRPHERGSQVAAKAAQHVDEAAVGLSDSNGAADIREAYRAAATSLSAAAVALTMAREALEVSRAAPPMESI